MVKESRHLCMGSRILAAVARRTQSYKEVNEKENKKDKGAPQATQDITVYEHINRINRMSATSGHGQAKTLSMSVNEPDSTQTHTQTDDQPLPPTPCFPLGCPLC